MPRIAEIRMIDGEPWARIEVGDNEGSITLWTPSEIAEFKRSCVLNFLSDLFNLWKERQ